MRARAREAVEVTVGLASSTFIAGPTRLVPSVNSLPPPFQRPMFVRKVHVGFMPSWTSATGGHRFHRFADADAFDPGRGLGLDVCTRDDGNEQEGGGSHAPSGIQFHAPPLP